MKREQWLRHVWVSNDRGRRTRAWCGRSGRIEIVKRDTCTCGATHAKTKREAKP